MSESNVDKLIKQHEDSKNRKQQKNSPSSGKGGGVDFSKYFNTFLPEGQDEGQKVIRILPHPNQDTPFEELFLHTATVETQNGQTRRQKVICLEKNFGEECPYCEAAKTLRRDAENDEEKKMAKDYDARLYYVVRVIDRDNEDRIKWWRFRDDLRNEGIFDKIMGIVKAKKEDISDPEKGRDLVLNLTRNRQGFVTVSSIIDREPSPIFDDEDAKNEWLNTNNEITWKEAYSIKNKEYLEILVTGGIPAYDRENGTFYDQKKESAKSQQESSEEDSASVSEALGGDDKESSSAETASSEEDTGNDLPF